MSAAPVASSAVPGRWLHGPVSDLLIGCGLWYALALGVLSFAGAGFREGAGPAVMGFAVLLFSTPHYGATLLRVYERREDRRTYALFAVWASLALFACFAVGVHQALVGSLLVTLYLTWSPWHYTGQNYGLAVMFLRRRGVELDPLLRRLLYASFVLSYALTFLAIHGGDRADHYTPLSAATDAAEAGAGYHFLSLGLPPALTVPLFALATLGYAGTLLASLALLLRRARLRDLLPSFALTATQALWFSVPLLLRHWEVDGRIDPWVADGAYYFLWIAVGHALQYLWVTSYYARRAGGGGTPAYLGRALLAGALVWTIPTLLFAPGLLGRLSYGSGLALLVASAVNLHHFVLDGAIWKLREGRVARILLPGRGRSETSDRPAPQPAGRGTRPSVWPWLIWSAGALCVAIMFVGRWEAVFGVRRAAAARDVPRLQRAVDHLSWIGRDSPKARVSLGRIYALHGDDARALAEFQRAIEIQPSSETWFALGSFHAARDQWKAAARAFEQAVALDPGEELAHYQLGLASMKLGRMQRAREAFARAAELNPARSINQTLLERAEQRIREAEEAGDPG